MVVVMLRVVMMKTMMAVMAMVRSKVVVGSAVIIQKGRHITIPFTMTPNQDTPYFNAFHIFLFLKQPWHARYQLLTAPDT